MSSRILAGLSVAAALAFAGEASAQITAATNICEATADGGGYTVRLGFLSHQAHFPYTFQTLPTGPTYVFPATAFVVGNSKKFLLPPGKYQISFKPPNPAPVQTYHTPLVVKPWQVVNGTCRFLNPLNKAAKVQAPVN